MFFNKLKAMSIGSLWTLRNRQAAQASSETFVMVVLAEPITNDAQQRLLENCLKAAGWNTKSSYFYAPDRLKIHIATSMPELIIVFGHTTATLIQPELVSGQLHHFEGARLIVTHHPSDMLNKPILKAQVWADLCLARQ